MEKILCNIKECLLQFNYPLSHSMTETELGDIFHTSNRCFLISWMLKLMNDAYKDIVDLEENKQNKEVLGNLIYELGFCSKNEQLPFMTGELDVNKQLNILYKMFKFIKLLKEPVPQDNVLPVSKENITLLTTQSINLFPMYGDIKVSTSRVEYSDEVSVSEERSVSETDLTEVSEVQDNIETLIEGLREHLPKLEVAAQSLPNDDRATCKENIIFNPSSGETLLRCNEYMGKVNQFIQDINTIDKFAKFDSTSVKAKDDTSESKELLKMLWEEIYVTLRYQQIK